MTSEIKENISHSFWELFTVHIVKLAIIGTCIDNNISTFQVLLLCNDIQFFHQRGWYFQLDGDFVTGHNV
jgi:hypothetical protein